MRNQLFETGYGFIIKRERDEYFKKYEDVIKNIRPGLDYMSKVRYLEVTIEKSMKYYRKSGEKS